MGTYVAPTLGALDGDGDLDAVMGNADGDSSYFQNTGSATAPVFTACTGADNPLSGIEAGPFFSVPTLPDLDRDGDVIVG